MYFTDILSFNPQNNYEMGYYCPILEARKRNIRAQNHVEISNIYIYIYLFYHIKYTYLVLPTAENKGQQHEGHIVDTAHWHFSYGLFERSDRTMPPVPCGKYCSQ